jgi:hypothetical protein
VYDPFSIAACNALLFIPITFIALNRHEPISTLLSRPHLYRAQAQWSELNIETVVGWFLRALFQAVLTYELVDLAVSSSLYPEGHPAVYSESAVVFCFFNL